MEQKERKIIDGIREGLLKVHDSRLKIYGNPYAMLGEEVDHKRLNIDANIIYEHLKLMELV